MNNRRAGILVHLKKLDCEMMCGHAPIRFAAVYVAPYCGLFPCRLLPWVVHSVQSGWLGDWTRELRTRHGQPPLDVDAPEILSSAWHGQAEASQARPPRRQYGPCLVSRFLPPESLSGYNNSSYTNI